ncbi:AGAP011764-PA [Anopheles gambiae str. PEST]|uniref:AGAP011764-PA n=1 Tax=Anopheles gambiae TaxID=7165 RepID=Q7PZ74_ANOGA|nr:AGAP011764-PA [Anopheles gambiae str. PEST]
MSASAGGLGGTASALLKSPQTALQLLLEEINFQRTKEMRQLLKDDGGFVVLQGTTYWTDLFVRHFLFQSEPEHSIDCDDLLFFVRKKHIKGSSRAMPRYETEIEVFRKDSRKLPIGDPDVDWEETVYLNLVIHQFNYTLTLAICTRTSPKELQVLRRHSQKVYASPSRRKMDTKGDSEEITYPHICFMVDNFDEVFHDILVRDGEMVCVELVATDRDGSVQGVIFLGSIRYDALKKVYDARQSSLGSKVAQRMSFGLFSSGGPQTRCEFVRMKGPQGKGHAEMAVTKPKGSGVETPTSEPGFCATDMWDSEWEEDCEEYYNYRHQRRLSDPSANLNNFSRYGWRTKNATDPGGSAYGGSKARSENEGLDCLANEVSEIEAGDLRDGKPRTVDWFWCSLSLSLSLSLHDHITLLLCAQMGIVDTSPVQQGGSSKSPTASNGTARHRVDPLAGPPCVPSDKLAGSSSRTAGCCSCFGRPGRKRWSTDADSVQMSEVYAPCPACGGGEADRDEEAETGRTASERKRLESLELHDSPACLATVSKGRSPLMKHRNVLIVESELEFAGGAKVRTGPQPSTANDKGTVVKKKPAADALSTVKRRENGSKASQSPKKRLSTPVFRSKRSNSATETADPASGSKATNGKAKASNAINNNTGIHRRSAPPSTATEATEATEEYEMADDAVSLNGGDLTAANGEPSTAAALIDPKQRIRVNGREEFPAERNNRTANGNGNQAGGEKLATTTAATVANIKEHRERRISTNNVRSFYARPTILADGAAAGRDGTTGPDGAAVTPPAGVNTIPSRRTPDGTNIYYLCDYHPRRHQHHHGDKELDDGAYNPLWTTKGFTQTFHFWKENRRQQSTPLNAFLTYVTLPWWSIAKDLLDHREQPILTF